MNSSNNRKVSNVPANFVAPPPKPPTPVKVEVVEAQPIDLPARHQVVISGTYQDRAKGFQISTVPLAVGVGVGSLLIAIGLFNVPFFSVTALLILWLGFLLTWFGGWLVVHLFSPEGTGLIGALGQLWLLRQEQKERWKYYDQSTRDR